jgi:hypothetical protein
MLRQVPHVINYTFIKALFRLRYQDIVVRGLPYGRIHQAGINAFAGRRTALYDLPINEGILTGKIQDRFCLAAWRYRKDDLYPATFKGNMVSCQGLPESARVAATRKKYDTQVVTGQDMMIRIKIHE